MDSIIRAAGKVAWFFVGRWAWECTGHVGDNMADWGEAVGVRCGVDGFRAMWQGGWRGVGEVGMSGWGGGG